MLYEVVLQKLRIGQAQNLQQVQSNLQKHGLLRYLQRRTF